ncbi:5-oxopent-3-ene-1,2,5-tricarboxylate decarboxylase/2-hydroxyhepta-2,4-diene-1,7-dioate isomerase [Streptosporangium album]|uniref:5-oxopent-3-ene-1,2,5-tricarboxylate decarboxylase/2-hydroxyhepta-2,4-diene-1,7-dioate isomerase n=1 Tax=Streptosporangium album TaxID=47479 RepID=A0A7W7S0I0_9ACTN|nr:fumarylacetoacetate hydrolase family protein [Streptosporangium album]MBB4941664.1 5-oxopent-3-ene-1,2,5-tricarboxylate decarboxylase/2-hydroxyhepta-2,4-diene-1,7-dioate isomerase [Streptosporangium album]
MYLGRIRRIPADQVEVVAWREGGELLSLSGLDGPADPVALLNTYGLERLTEEVDRLWTTAPALLEESSVFFEPPVATCTKICCLALNYLEHAEESGLEVPPVPVLFFKPPSALTGHNRPVEAPARTKHLEHEVELAVVIGSTTRDLPAERWQEAVAGYTVINDMTARDLQLANIDRNVPWDQAKGFDTFAPTGPYLATMDEVPDPQALELRLEVDGQVRQRANTKQMVFGIPQLIADLSDGMTLEPGDLIATGTIAGIAPLQEGDVMRATVAGVGTLVNRVTFRTA